MRPPSGDPDGAVTLSPDVVERHSFGERPPRPAASSPGCPRSERSGSGAPWHVTGSLLGLDLALARSALRRLSVDDMPAVPTVNLNDQLTLARTAVALRSIDFDDATRDELAAAIRRGRARVAAAGTSITGLLALADEVALTSASRQTLGWTLGSFPEARSSLFSTRDLLWLGRPRVDRATLARWGVIGDSVDGRLATRFDAPTPWDQLAGRPDMGVLATQVPDLTLRLVEATAEKGVPAALIPALLLFATQDYWHEVEARFADDWPAMVRGAAGPPDRARRGLHGRPRQRRTAPATLESATSGALVSAEPPCTADSQRRSRPFSPRSAWARRRPPCRSASSRPVPTRTSPGPVLLKAIVEPPPRAREATRVLFYADGRLVCTVTDTARAECPWDAGAEVKEHLVRVVVDLKDGEPRCERPCGPRGWSTSETCRWTWCR